VGGPYVDAIGDPVAVIVVLIAVVIMVAVVVAMLRGR